MYNPIQGEHNSHAHNIFLSRIFQSCSFFNDTKLLFKTHNMKNSQTRINETTFKMFYVKRSLNGTKQKRARQLLRWATAPEQSGPKAGAGPLCPFPRPGSGSPSNALPPGLEAYLRTK